MDAWRELYRLAARQHRCVTVWQTDEIGLARRTLENRARREHWERPYRGVLVVPGAPRSYAQEVGAALLSTRPSGAAACEAAAYVHNLVTKPARPVPVAVRDGPASPGAARPAAAPAERTAAAGRAGGRSARRDEPGLDPVRPGVRAVRRRPRAGDRDGRPPAAGHALVRSPPSPTGGARFPAAGRSGALSPTWAGSSRTQRPSGSRVASCVRLACRPIPGRFRSSTRAGPSPRSTSPSPRSPMAWRSTVRRIWCRRRRPAADRARDRRLGRLGWSIDRFTDEEVEGAPAAFVGHVEPRVAALGRAAAR